MKALMLVLSLSIAGNAVGAHLAIERGRPLEPVESEQLSAALRDAFAVFSLADGSRWVTHRVPARVEPSPIGVTRFGADNSSRVFLFSDWLPKGKIPSGWCGQIYGIALLEDGRVAVSGGWNDGADSHNAIVVLRPRKDGAYDTDQVFEWPGVRRIAAGPRNTIVAVTHDAALKDGGPLVTVFTAEGQRLGHCCGPRQSLLAAEAARNASDARLVRISEHRFALYDPSTETIFVLDIDREGPRGSVWTPVSVIFVGDDTRAAALPVIDIVPAGRQEMLVARTGRVDGRFATVLTVYGSVSDVKNVAVTEYPWRFLVPEKGRLRGVVVRGAAQFDTVAFRPGE